LRLDKFLKVARIIKRRTIAKEACDKKQVLINDRPAKAGAEVNTGDLISIHLGQRRLKIKVAAVKDTVPAKEAAMLYELIEDYKNKHEL